jgi:transposase
MNTSKRYPQEEQGRAVRMVFEHEHEYQSRWFTIESFSAMFGYTVETLRRWVM